MAFYLKNLSTAFVTVTVGQDQSTILPGKFTGPFDDEDVTADIRNKARKRIIAVVAPGETAEKQSQIEPEPSVEPADIEPEETEEY